MIYCSVSHPGQKKPGVFCNKSWAAYLCFGIFVLIFLISSFFFWKCILVVGARRLVELAPPAKFVERRVTGLELS